MKINYTYSIKNNCQYKNIDHSYKNEIQEQCLDNTLLGIEYPRNYKNAISFTGNGFLSEGNIRTTFPCFSDKVSTAFLRQNFNKREKYNKLKILYEGVQDKKDIEYLITNQNTTEDPTNEDILKQLLYICDNLSEEEIEKYKSFRNNNSDNKQLDLKSFIDRFIEIRNKNIENTDKKTVQRGKPKELKNPIKYPVHLALKWAFEGKTDDDIKKEYRQIELITMGYDIKTALHLASLNDNQFIRYNQLVSQGEDYVTAYDVARLDDKQYEKYKQLRSDKKEKYIAFHLARLDEAQYERYKQLIDQENKTPYEALNITNNISRLDDKQYERYDQLIKQKGITPDEALSLAWLDETQFEKYKQLIKQGKEPFDAVDLARLDETQFEKYKQLIKQEGITPYKALVIAKLTKEELQRLNKRSRNLTDDEAYILAKETTLSFLTPEQIKELPENIFYLISTGQSEDIHDAMQNAIRKALDRNFKVTAKDADITTNELSLLNNNIKKDSNTTYSSQELELLIENNELNVKYNKTQKEFNVLIKKRIIDGKTILYIKDKNSDKEYIAYNGAIALIDENNSIKDENGNDVIDERTKLSLLSSHNMYPEKQSEILAKASKEFIFSTIDENGESIIGKGLNGEAPLVANYYSDKDIQEYFGEKLTQLNENKQLTAENLLRIFPKNAILIIRPYAQEDSNMLYSIGAQWYSKDNNRWEIRIHSTDLKFADDNANWVFRLGYTHPDSLNNDVTTYFQFADNSYNFDGEFSGDNSKDSHIHIKSPLPENNLLNNIDFQKIIQQISKIL